MIDDTQAWAALRRHAAEMRERHLRDLFGEDPERADRLAFEIGSMYVDLSKHLVTDETIDLLVALGEEAGIRERIDAMFAGERINATEDRAVLHTALRASRDAEITLDGDDVVTEVHDVLARMRTFAAQVRDGEHRGATGEPIETVVNIGIGGSDLGPRMAAHALRNDVADELELRFVSNIDGGAVHWALRDLDPATTLVIVSSKSFTTLETLTNAHTARDWLTEELGEDAVAHHFVAVSTNEEGVREFGIDADNMFGFWDWVGGRYSLPSAIGLSLMIGIGPDAFRDMLAGYRTVDEHLRDTRLRHNVPVLHGLLAVWYRDFLGASTRAVLPYLEELRLLPRYLQQLDMESNGKRVTLAGEPVGYPTGPVVWGEAGTDGQHAFFQLLHQGTELVPADLIGVCRPPVAVGEHHDLLTANLLAQAEALAFGRTAEEARRSGVAEELVAHRTFPGNRPTTTILLDELTPTSLGELVALYEHSVLTQGAVWGINSFDQWGVELGKQLAGSIADELTEDRPAAGAGHDTSTEALLQRYRSRR